MSRTTLTNLSAASLALIMLATCGPERGPQDFTGGQATGESRFCCDANDNCSPAPPLPGVCPTGTITTVCDENMNCIDEE